MSENNKAYEFEKELDNILSAIHDDILITDGKGIVINVSPTFESVYGVSREDAIGQSVYDMERQGVFKPSIIAIVLKTGQKVTMTQINNKNRDIIVTATPVKNTQGEITRVISYSRDITEFKNLQQQHELLENKFEKYAEELELLRSESLEIAGVVSKSIVSQNVIKTINKVAKFDVNVLLTGESGVGKTMFAKLIHNKSNRAEGPFIEINCGAIPENLLESELFGYEKGSFTGANKEGKIGLIELTENGTLFLDEVSEIPPSLQVKLLKVIQDKTIIRVGGTKEIQVDFRLIAASNKDFKALIRDNLFREDLYYRLNVITIDIPPLRERREDLIHLIKLFLERFNESYKLKKKLSQGAFDLLCEYKWPGNIRELENALERLVLTSESDFILPSHLPKYINKNITMYELDNNVSLRQRLEKYEREIVCEAYNKCGSTIGVAKILGISQPSAVRKIQKYVKKI
ncbi:sigma-54 interaction domain-containing protein [Anaerovorax odorimutans]|uniref:sigma-54 interaction domain-containing protein n=1 Tax=Anaerovorax odorimutans TaxID=109327 RepID=UPI0003F8709B|nr:sigma 54-interacting transcriptional regulator [Anaerovorax odorimutans]